VRPPGTPVGVSPGPGPGRPLRTPAVPRGSGESGRALRGPGARKSPFSGIFPEIAGKRPFWAFPGDPRQNPVLGYRGAPARGVDVKPPSRRVLAGSGKAYFGQKGRKRPKKGKKGQKAHFSHFRGFSAPPGLPGTRFSRGFYINPSRRGPAVPREGWGGETAPSRRGVTPGGGQGVSPWA